MKTKLTLLVLSLGVLFVGKATAEVASGEAAATPLTINVTSTVGLGVGFATSASSTIASQPVPTVSGTAPAPFSESAGPQTYNDSGAAASVEVPTVLPVLELSATTLQLGATGLQSSASSNVDGAAGARSSQASAELANMAFNIGKIDSTVLDVEFLSLSALSITAGNISASAQVNGLGAGGAFAGSFTRSVENFDITVFGVSILSFFGPDVANDLFLGEDVDVSLALDEISITLPSGLSDLVTSGTIRISNAGTLLLDTVSGQASASALRIDLQNVVIQANVDADDDVSAAVRVFADGDFDLAAVEAVAAVPEPSTVALLIVATALALLFHRRRSRQVGAA